ncbi:transposon Ty3-I Gag-Pol polyprotein [Trichonephila inaurata madagascariensis]|uniref:Transposon Ty3-I Gag-Pol polyprotein n=1 Tax=Trichonephila inaurata madagascariensis TaxID=2747483 RepID=A0A8X7BSV8_9ARAC|nr:transposon Ty3-I Gag-Pol polyprotein [Trichonephila inaurata madagascariensis]
MFQDLITPGSFPSPKFNPPLIFKPLISQNLADSQTKDEELKTPNFFPKDLSFKLKPLKMGGKLFGKTSVMSVKKKYGLMSRGTLLFKYFFSFPNLSHPGIRVTKRAPIQNRFVWPSMLKDIAKWTRCCIPCQRAKIPRHTVSPKQPFFPKVRKFLHVFYRSSLGHFPPSDGLPSR